MMMKILRQRYVQSRRRNATYPRTNQYVLQPVYNLFEKNYEQNYLKELHTSRYVVAFSETQTRNSNSAE